MTAFSSGPWHLSESGDSVPWLHIYCADHKSIWHVDRSEAEKLANSRLIAAAPSMAAAINEAMDFLVAQFGQISNPEDALGWSSDDAFEVYRTLAKALPPQTEGGTE